ncbi:LLM class flavin-dependent oxidoreductase [Microbacterium sp. YY-01]|uniref:LLM class flavin-dependent oxidoreductase n=1 Tax=Microbacterium sp. YY-01 TaxID=3421634 RepID=UPI003D176187
MKIGVAPSGRRSAADAVELARIAEGEGLAEVWVSEDYLERGAFAVAGAIAAATSSVSVGLGVINPWTRHVALAAMEAHALDEIAQGRSIVGLGASNEGWMSGRLGIPFRRPIALLQEYSQALRRLLAGERVAEEVAGLLLDAQLDATPARDIPIVWGVKGPRALQLGADEADGLMLSVLSSPGYVRWVRQQYAPAHITAYASFRVDADPAAARESLRGHTARFLGMHGASAITEYAGLDQTLAHQWRERLLSGRDASDLVDDATVSAVTVSGTPDDAAHALLAHRKAGVDSLIVIDDGRTAPAQLVGDLVKVMALAGLS